MDGVGLTAGVIAGIATGDLSKGAQYAAGGFGIGYQAGGKMTGNVYDDIFYDGAKEELEKGWYGKDYLEHQRKEAEKKYKRDDKNIEYIQQHLGLTRSEAKKVMNEDYVQKALRAGVNDIADIATISSLSNGKSREEINNLISVAAFRKEYGGSPYDLSEEEYEKVSQKFDRKIRKKYPGLTDEEANNFKVNMFNLVDDYDSKRHAMTSNDLK